METGPRRWTAREIRLLGRYNDAELSRRLRRTHNDVRFQRLSLHIPSLRPLRMKRWTRTEEKLLARFPDKELARRFGRSVASVQGHRFQLRPGICPVPLSSDRLKRNGLAMAKPLAHPGHGQ